jgi:hypothetical protein
VQLQTTRSEQQGLTILTMHWALLYRALMQQTTGVTPTDKDAASWMWEGMGTDGAAVRVPGLSGVRAVQLGSAHVLALLN